MTRETEMGAGRALTPFEDPNWTAKGEARAHVALSGLKTLWFNTGTLCNIECVGCYIESSPTNDRLVYISEADVAAYLDEIAENALPTDEIGFTGGEPFMNPEMNAMTALVLSRGFQALILTNAMRPMMRKSVREGLLPLIKTYKDQLTLRISLDHHSAKEHDALRGKGAFEKTLEGMRWLRDAGARMAVAGRTLWDEPETEARAAFAALFAREGFDIDAQDPGAVVLFPEMDERVETPEITTACWDILGKSPESVMCASSRMVVKRKGAGRATVAACTLLPYDKAFDLGATLAEASRDVPLNHPHCSKFCVLGGASCSA